MMNINNDMKRTRVRAGMTLKGLLCAALFTIHCSLFTIHCSLFTSCTREDDLSTVMEEYNPENAYGDYDEAH